MVAHEEGGHVVLSLTDASYQEKVFETEGHNQEVRRLQADANARYPDDRRKAVEEYQRLHGTSGSATTQTRLAATKTELEKAADAVGEEVVIQLRELEDE